MTPAQKAWATRRARAAAAALSAISAVTPAAAAPARPAPPAFTSGEHLAAIYAEKERARAEKLIADAPRPVEELIVVNLWVDHPTVGCGTRLFVVLEMGARIVRLFDPCRLVKFEVGRDVFDRHAQTLGPRKFKRARIADYIRANRARADRANDAAGRIEASDGGADAVRALELLAG